MLNIKILDTDFVDEVPTSEGTYAVRKKTACSGFSNAQVVRVLKIGDELWASGPGWPSVKQINTLPFKWGPKIEIQVDKDQWY